MARKVREKCESNTYHVMLRGINRQQIFLDAEDNQRFLEVLEKCQEISGFRVFAYCLMGNHVHLLLQVIDESLEQVMKRIGTRYVMWYNKKYSRTGHLFQDRYRSEAVTDDTYFLTVLRYILNNPVKAGMCGKAEDYRWSSTLDYYTGGGITETAFAEGLLGREALLEYLKAVADDTCMDDAPSRLGDRMAREIIAKTVGEEDESACQRRIREEPEKYVGMLRNAGLSLRQISRLSGLSVGIIRKWPNG